MREDGELIRSAPTKPWTVKRTSIYGANGALVFVAAPMTTDADSALAASAPELLAAAQIVLKGFDDAVFIRNIDSDDKPGWAMHALPFIAALARLAKACEGKP